MSEISKNFQHQIAEAHWYQHWMEQGYFYSTPDHRPAYTIVMPPPNVTGVLHMGHALNNTVQDILIRRAIMQGYNTCWVPGTDHASIATEAKVVAMLREQGIDKNTLSREEFLKYAWEWKEKYGGIILSQLKKLGCSLDWNKTAFTMDDTYYAAVIKVFVDLYQKGNIYRGVKMINWDPKAQTALSDEEVIHKQCQSKLYYVRYRIDSPQEEYITIATVRPETILGDTAICVHPEDPRYQHLKGAYCYVPLTDRKIPIIMDTYIDKEFGTGALKVTPAHDINDYNLGIKYKLPVIDTLNSDGTMSAAAGRYIGEDRFVVRKKIIEDLKDSGNFVKEENYQNQVGYSERTDVVIEPRLSMQWWCKMEQLAQPALKQVLDEQIEFFPPKFKNLYKHWMENIKDWCISRQLWWGQRIPAWYDADQNIYVAQSLDEAYLQYIEQYPNGKKEDLKQDDDCLDTWFSSWLWPMQVFGWNEAPNNEALAYYYPTSTLVTAPEIIFFWVARMIMAGNEYLQQKPFDKVYFTGIVRDKQGRKMSKSLGNSPDLLQLIDQYGADAVRFSVIIASPAGNDLLYDESMLDQGRNFCNKMWNAMKLLKMWEPRVDTTLQQENHFALIWMQERINEVQLEVEQLMKDFRLSEALKTTYSLIWDDFCSWYLEWVKPAPEQAIAKNVFETSQEIFVQLLQLLHPFLPFVTEEIYHLLAEQKEDLMVKALTPIATIQVDSAVLQQAITVKELISAVRDARVKNNLKPKDPIQVQINSLQPEAYLKALSILEKQLNANNIQINPQSFEGNIVLVVGKDKIYLKTENSLDSTAQKAQLEKDLAYLKGFLVSVEKKLSNAGFVAKAKPEIIAMEQKKMDDAKAKIQSIEESLALL